MSKNGVLDYDFQYKCLISIPSGYGQVELINSLAAPTGISKTVPHNPIYLLIPPCFVSFSPDYSPIAYLNNLID